MSREPFKGKAGVVTGGGQGIGKGIVKHLLNEGMSVVIAEIDEEAGQETESQMRSFGPVRFVRTDVRDEDSVKNLMTEALREFGSLDALVNNAGIAGAEQGPVEKLSLDYWHRMISTHLTGTFLCVKHASPHLRRARGAIVNIGSTRAFQSEPNTEAYAVAKGGIVSLTHALAMSLGPDVRVNCIAPGWIDVRDGRKGSGPLTLICVPSTTLSTPSAGLASLKTLRHLQPSCCRIKQRSSPGRRSSSMVA